MTEIKLINKKTDINSLKMRRLDWDFELNGRPYYVVRIEDYIHTIGGKWGDNDLWAYPRNESPSYENLIEFTASSAVMWGIRYEPTTYCKTKWDETEIRQSNKVTITRNGKDFYSLFGGINYGIDKARTIIAEIDEHPLDLNIIDYDKKMIGKKIWYRSQPAIITHYCNGQACIIIEADNEEKKFIKPAEYNDDDMFYDIEDDIKVNIFDRHIWWFRN